MEDEQRYRASEKLADRELTIRTFTTTDVCESCSRSPLDLSTVIHLEEKSSNTARGPSTFSSIRPVRSILDRAVAQQAL